MTQDTTAPRAVLLSPDERTLYVAEGEAGGPRRCELRAYPIADNGEVGEYRVLHTFTSTGSKADRGVEGMCLDRDGNIVACAGWTRGGPGPLIYVFAPSGAVIETSHSPRKCRHAAPSGGEGLAHLYLTCGQGNLYHVKNFRGGFRAKVELISRICLAKRRRYGGLYRKTHAIRSADGVTIYRRVDAKASKT